MAVKKKGYGAVIKALRKELELTQEEFAATYNIPIDTLKSWELDRREPDSTAASYLIIVAKHPALVKNVLERAKKSPCG